MENEETVLTDNTPSRTSKLADGVIKEVVATLIVVSIISIAKPAGKKIAKLFKKNKPIEPTATEQ